MIFRKRGDEVVEISKELQRLHNQEPGRSNMRSIIRTNIMGYELGDLQKFTSKNSYPNLNENIKRGLEENAKLAMADLIVQCRMLCLDHFWDFDEIQILGLEHLKERHLELKQTGFAEDGGE